MVEEKARQALSTINAYVGGPYRLDLVDPAVLQPAPKNARYMTAEQFKSLKENVSKDGRLGSVPLCWRLPSGGYRVLSGNHRVKAAVSAGVNLVIILYTDRELSRSEEVSIQLSHNSISGQDDPKVLRDLWDEIATVEWKHYSGLDDKLLEQLAAVNMPAISEIRLDTRAATFIFLPEELDRLEELFKYARSLACTKDLFLVRLADYDRCLDALTKTEAAYNVINGATALGIVLDLFEANQDQLQEGWLNEETGDLKHKKLVPLSSLFGSDEVPVAVALKLKKALDHIEDLDPKKKWRALETWAEREIAG